MKRIMQKNCYYAAVVAIVCAAITAACTFNAISVQRAWADDSSDSAFNALASGQTDLALSVLAATEPTPDYSWYSASATTFTLQSETGKTLAAKLIGLRNIVAGTAPGIAADDFSGKTITIASAQNFLGMEWTPIGTEDHPFNGTFDGGNYTLSNFSITATYSNAGFFGVCGKDSVLKNIVVSPGTSGSITLGTSTAPYTQGKISCVGAIVGKTAGQMYNCTSSYGVSIYNNTPVTDSQTTVVDAVGGVAGRIAGTSSGLTFSGAIDVRSDCNTENPNDQGYIIMTCIGGVVGFFGDLDSPGTTTSTLTNSSNAGTVRINTVGTALDDRFDVSVAAQAGYVGGVAGYTTGTMEKCANTGAVDTSYVLKKAYVASATDQTNIGASGCYIGGVVGAVRGDIFPGMTAPVEGAIDAGTASENNPIYVRDCYNTGSVFGNHGVGGVVGEVGWYSTVIGCYCNIPVGTAVKPTKPEREEGQTDAEYYATDAYKQYLSDLYTYFENVGGVKAARWNKPICGGVVGKCYGNVAYCYNRSRTWSTTDAGYLVAGCVGVLFRGTDIEGYTAPTPELWGCYNTGYAQSSLRAASLLGQNEGYVHDSYAIPETSYHSASGEENLIFEYYRYGAEARLAFLQPDVLQSSEGASKLNYMAASEGWDEYYISPGDSSINDGYPILAWQYTGTPESIADKTDKLTVTLADDADYNGSAAVPKLKVVLSTDEGDVELIQDADFRVVVDKAAVDKTLDVDRATGTRPYTATIEGIGRYTGAPGNSVKYGIVIGNLSSCTVVANEKVYNGLEQTVTASDIKLISATGTVVPSDAYTFTVNGGAACVKRGDYSVTATAKVSEDANYVGTLTDAQGFTIAPADIHTDCVITGVTANGTTYGPTEFSGMTFTYTGSPILPTIDGITYAPAGAQTLTLSAGSSLTDVNGDYYVQYLSDSDYVNVVRDEEGNYAKININVQSCNANTIGNYHNYVDLYYQIVPASLDSCTITTPDQVYTGQARGATQIVFNGETLVEGTDYTVEYSNNVNVGTATATITGIGNFTGTVTRNYQILNQTPVDMSTCSIDDIDAQSWTGAAVEPSVVVKNADGIVLTQGIDYIASYSNNVDAAAATAENAPTVTITGAGVYNGTISKTFAIVSHQVKFDKKFGKYDSRYMTTTIDGTRVPISGKTTEDPSYERGLNATVSVTVTRSTAYSTEYNLRGLTVTGDTTGKTYPVEITELSNQTQTSGVNVLKCTFTVPDEDVTITGPLWTEATKSLADCTIDPIADVTYTGSALCPDVVVRDAQGNKLVEGVDYNVPTYGYSNNVDPGTATVFVVGMGDYSGSVSGSFTIKGKGTLTVSASDVSVVYDGSAYGVVAQANEPGATIRYGLAEDECTSEASPTFTDAGTYTVYFKATVPGDTAMGSAKVTIGRRSASVTANDAEKIVGHKTPTLSATVNGVIAKDADFLAYSVALAAGSDYEVAGTYPGAIVASGEAQQGNYDVTYVSGTLTVRDDSPQAGLEVYADDVKVTYDASGHGVVASANKEGATIYYGTSPDDCSSVTCPTFTDAGTHTVYLKATLDGYADATGEASVVIGKALLTVAANEASKEYGAAAPAASTLSATVTGLQGADTFVRGTDYEISLLGIDVTTVVGTYENAVRVSSVSACNNYDVTWVNAAFTVTGKDIAAATVGGLKDVEYDGVKHEPNPDVSLGSTKLTRNVDYTVEYQTDPGESVTPLIAGWYRVVIHGMGNYAGTATATSAFNITVKGARLHGDTELDTMKDIVNEGFSETGGTVVLTTNGGYWDALTASGLAGLMDAPVLLTNGSSLSDQTRYELVRLAPSRVLICGGPVSVSYAVESQVADLTGAQVVRCSGLTATGTACDVYNKAKTVLGKTWGKTAFIATDDGYWDALAIAPYAYAKGDPIFLSEGHDSVSEETISTIKSGGFDEVYIVGGPNTVKASVIEQLQANGITVTGRLSGIDAIETSQKIADFELARGMTANYMALATSNGYWDALCGAALCGKRNSVLLLVEDANTSSIDKFVTAHKSEISEYYIFGGELSVSPSVATKMANVFK